MIFRVITLVLFCTSLLSASSYTYEMMPGQYSMELVLTDSQESYPVSISFSVNDTGKIYKGSVDYPTYDCKANFRNSVQNKLEVTTKERMIQGFDTCNPSTYTMQINKRNFFSPRKRSYFKLGMFDGEENVKVKVKSYFYKQTAYAKYRIQNKYKSIDSILDSTNSSSIRQYIKLSNTKALKLKAKKKLKLLVSLENSEYNKIKNSNLTQDYKKYIGLYSGSKHIQKSKNKIALIEKNIKIAQYRKKSNPNSFYKAYNLSKEGSDIINMLAGIVSLKMMDDFFANKQELMSNKLVKKQYVYFYQKENSFSGFMSAYRITHSKNDIQNAYKLANKTSEKKIIELALFKYFGESKFLNVQIGDSSESTLKELKSGGFLTSFRGMGKDYYKTVNVELDKNKGMKFQYGKYKIELKIKLDLDYTPHINGKGKDYVIKNITLVLDNSNQYITKETVIFTSIPVQGEYHIAALGGLKFLAGLMGQDTSKISEEIPIQLNNTMVKYEVISIESF